jgi:hypothetical protein
MKKFFNSALSAYNKYKNFRRLSRLYRVYRTLNYAVVSILTAYILTLAFPQYLFANHARHGNFDVYSRAPLGENIDQVLDSAEARLAISPIYDAATERRIFLTDSHAFYTFLANKAAGSFAHSVPLLDNVIVNRSDIADDRVFIQRAYRDNRSLSGVIAHEVTHLFIRKKFGTARTSLFIPAWKNEGYCEYIAGDTTISFADGAKLWREDPNDDSKYAYYKYHQMVKYLLDDEKISVEELFDRDFDMKALEAKIFAKVISGNR